jgi:hypothetical protein
MARVPDQLGPARLIAQVGRPPTPSSRLTRTFAAAPIKAQVSGPDMRPDESLPAVAGARPALGAGISAPSSPKAEPNDVR